MHKFYHVLKQILITIVISIVFKSNHVYPSYTYCNSFVIRCPQQIPSELIQTNIGHRFYGPISEGAETLYGLDSGANVILYTSYTLSTNDKIHLHRIKQDKELQIGYQRSEQIQNTPISLMVQFNANWFKENNQSVFNGFSIFGATYDLNIAQLHTNFGFDHYNETNGFGAAIVWKLSENWDSVIEGFSTNNQNDSALSIGTVYHTFGHRFKLGIHNSTAMSFKTLMTGTSNRDWVFGFQIHRLLEID